MDLATLAVNYGAAAAAFALAAWKVVDHLKAGQAKDKEIAALKSRIELEKAKSYPEYQTVLAAQREIHKGQIDTVKELTEELVETRRQLAEISRKQETLTEVLRGVAKFERQSDGNLHFMWKDVPTQKVDPD